MKKIIEGNITYDPSVDYSNVEKIGGYLYCSGADTKASFPKLTTVGGSLYCSGADTKASFPKLTTVGGRLYCSGADTKASFPKLTTVGGRLYCSGADTKASFPKLTTVGGSLYCSGADTKASFPKLTTVGGSLYCSGADTKASFPKLTTVGGRLDCADTKAAFPKLTSKGAGSGKADRRVIQAFRRKNFLFADGILAKITETKQLKSGAKIHKVVIVGKSKTSYCLESDGVFSHGDTIKEARESLLYKVGERDKSHYEKWNLKTKITKKEAIDSYRVITGACESGVRHFVESSGKLKRKYTVREVIKLTKEQYGNNVYSDFFCK